MRRVLTLACFGLALSLASAAAASPAQDPFAFFDGGGSGSTAQSAVASAIDDATVTASGFGRFHCELVGEPQVFPQPPGSRRAFAAQVRMYCV